MELSGCDAVFVLDDADVNLVTDCLLFGLTLNKSQTCMAPRRVFASDEKTDAILRLLKSKLEVRESQRQESQRQDARVGAVYAQSRSLRMAASTMKPLPAALAGLRFSAERSLGRVVRAAVLDHVTPEMAVAQSDLFAPVLSFIRTASTRKLCNRMRNAPMRLVPLCLVPYPGASSSLAVFTPDVW